MSKDTDFTIFKKN